ncbi:MAG: hypothetical protein HFJ09_05270 [Lachnospiraceae bacterium]|nr:hypothetical protein [Lachnospiraceae bacterium]
MLENKPTMAEIIIQKKKKYNNGETEDYVHPKNRITKGYVIINYKKREMEEKKLMDAGISMTIPADWEKAETGWEDVYFYKAETEKESLVLKYCEDFHKQPVTDILQEILGEGDKTKIQKEIMEMEKEEGKISYLFWEYSKELTACVFIWQVEGGFLQGCFQIHPYRRKVWEGIIPQILEQMKWPEKQKVGEQEENEQENIREIL